jgi:hypothetical protein
MVEDAEKPILYYYGYCRLDTLPKLKNRESGILDELFVNSEAVDTCLHQLYVFMNQPLEKPLR